MNPQTSLGGLVQSSAGTPAGNTTPQDFTNLSGGDVTGSSLSDFITPDIAATLSGGGATTSNVSPAFDPALYGPGGPLSPTGTESSRASDPAVAAAQQDPSGQIPDDQQRVDRAGKGDRATTQDDTEPTTPTRSAAAAPAAAAAGPTGLTDQPQPGGQAAPAAAAQSPLAQIAKAFMANQKKPAAAPAAAAVDQPAAAAPQPTGAPGQTGAPAAAAPPSQRQQAPGGGTPQPALPPAAQAGTAGGAPPGVPPLLQAILNMLGLGGLTGGGAPLGGVAQQAMPQPRIGPIAPTAGLGPYARARARAGGQPGNYAQPSQAEWESNVAGGGGVGPAPGMTGEVEAPTDQQVRQGRLAGTDTQPTAGFSPVLERERAKFREPLNDPRTRWEALAMIALENGGDPAAVAESFLNRCDYAKTSPRNMLHSGFYGPVNFGKLGREIRRLQANPREAARLNAGLETALRGSNLLGGATDQGSGRDPNVGWRGGRIIRHGETYNDWGGGPGGHDGAALYRKQQQQRVRAAQNQVAMDITRNRVPFGTPELEGGGMIRRGAPASEFDQMQERRQERERERIRTRAGMVS